MHYYYNFLINLDTCFWSYYEWEKTDNLIWIKKMPVVKISDRDIKKFLEYDISFSKDWVSSYLDKTLIKSKRTKLSCILFSSGKNSLVLEVNENGKVLSRSKLLMLDECDCNDFVSHLKSEWMEYELLDKLRYDDEFRKAIYEKHMIEVELNTLKETHNLSKCSYLYYEWFGVIESDMEKMLKNCYQELKKPYTLKIHEITELIEMSYKECL